MGLLHHPFWLHLILVFLNFSSLKLLCLPRITDEGSVPEMRIESILLMKFYFKCSNSSVAKVVKLHLRKVSFCIITTNICVINFETSLTEIAVNHWFVSWLVVLRISVALAVFQPYRDFEAGDNQSLKFKWRGGESNPGPLAPQAYSLTTRPLPLLSLHWGLSINCSFDSMTVVGSGKVGPFNLSLTTPVG